MIYFKTIFTIIVSIVLPAFTLSSKPYSKVQELTDTTFDSVLEDPANDLWFLKFYAPWCGHCKKLEPVLDEIAPQTQGKMAVGKVDCTKYKDLCKKFKVHGFPTLKYYRDGNFGDYSGDRDAKSLIAFATRMSQNAIVPIRSYNDAMELAKGHTDGVAFIAYDENAKGHTLDDIIKSTSALQVYHKVARQQQSYDLFGLIMPGTSSKEIQKIDVGSETKTFIAKVEVGMETKPYRGEITPPEILHFIQSNNVGILTNISSHNFKSMGNKGRPLAFAVIDPTNEKVSNDYIEKIKDFAKNGLPALTGKYYFCSIDGKRWKKFLQQFDIEDTNLPEFFVLDVPTKTYWRDANLSKDFSKFLYAIQNGEIKSQKQTKSSNKVVDFIISVLEPIFIFVDDHLKFVLFGILSLIPVVFYFLVREGEVVESGNVEKESKKEK